MFEYLNIKQRMLFPDLKPGYEIFISINAVRIVLYVYIIMRINVHLN